MKSIDTRYVNLSYTELVAHALDRQEGRLDAKGVLCVETGQRTGRSPKDRFIVCDEHTESKVHWGRVNQPMTPTCAQALWKKAEKYLNDLDHPFLSELRVGAHATHALDVDVVTEFAWHQMVARNLMIQRATVNYPPAPRWQILNLPGCIPDPTTDGTHSDGVVVIDFTQRRVLLLGMRYAGEMKKAMFTALNYALPQVDVLPMHCAANTDLSGKNTVLFFGLSGTGKTTLSSDPDRLLIGDDEHGWSQDGVFNFEGGCYAKCLNLSPKREPVIWNAIKIGAVMENVALDPITAEPHFGDDSLSQNSRVAYPRSHLEQVVQHNAGPTPHAVIFLTCDLYGVLPPVAKLTRKQAAYYFLSGYTAHVGSTEVGSAQAIQPTFSSCFGAPFFPMHPQVYADLLLKRLDESGADVFLVNTGWQGGRYGQGGTRYTIDVSRQVVHAIMHQTLAFTQGHQLPGFQLALPDALPGTHPDPRTAWSDPQAYETAARELITQFHQQMDANVSPTLRDAAPV